MKMAQELRSGNTFTRGNVVFMILKTERHQSTSGRKARTAEVRIKIKDLISGKVTTENIDATEKMNDIILDKMVMQFLYADNEDYNFMDQNTFEQITLTKEDLEDATNYLKEEMIIDILAYEGRPVGVELPTMVDLKVTYTEPGLKGDTTGKAMKPATVETGLVVQVPLFIKMDEYIKIDTRTGEYSERTNK